LASPTVLSSSSHGRNLPISLLHKLNIWYRNFADGKH